MLNQTIGYFSQRQHSSGAAPSITITPPTGHEVVIYTITARCDQASQVLNIQNASAAGLVSQIPIGNEQLQRDFGIHGMPCGQDVVVSLILRTPSSVGSVTVSYATRSRA